MIKKNNEALRKAFSMFSTGITIVTATDKYKNPIGMTVNSFSSVSLDPPLVLWSIGKKQPSYESFLDAKGYAVNILSNKQIKLCNHFASSLEDKFDSDPVAQLVNSWCSDDKGKNILYKKCGEERYPDFKLYKMIARTVHNHTPQNQIANPLFSGFLSSKKQAGKRKIINIFL